MTVPVLAVLAALLAGAAVWLGAQGREAQARADDRQDALRAASTHAMNLLSLHYETVDADVHRILTSSTGAARTAYEAAAGELVRTTRKNKVIQEGVVRAAGLESISGNTARALVVADVVIRWDGSDDAPQERFYRWRMDLAKTGGVWLVAKAEQVT
ncbi:hypothetical protein OUY22_16435 [Nonomuraea sp. MCN248]|uniref:Mce-associated membrane protein n=1 Tax=Nonomuraea corallina TaxID=2989783 RepID=A0ABT4SCS4_9ACTN|nr:hypothetical protein [Nonomuraea corallina]MDA0635008.1 hypothetical protein [Nonomuraea corallina]